MSMSAKKITQTFNGRTEWLIAGGSFFKLLSSVNPVDVELYQAGGLALLAPQVDSGFYQRVPFDRVVITTGALEPVSFLVAPEEGGSDTFSGVVSGTIDVTDRAARLLGIANLAPADARYLLFGDYESQQADAFIGSSTAGPVAGQVSVIQLWNPAASGVIAYVDLAEHCNLTAAARWELRQNAAALGAAVGEFNKRLGGAAAACELRAGASAAPGGTVIYNSASPVNVIDRVPLKAPFVVDEGNGLVIVGFTVNQSLLGSFQWREKAT